MRNKAKSSWRVAILALAPLLAGCLAENAHTIIVDPVDVKPFEGYWISTRGDAAQVLAIKAEEKGARSAKLTYVFMRHDTQQVDTSRLTVRATEIGKVLYFEFTGALDANKPSAAQRSFGRVSLGSAETPGDRDKFTVCLAEADVLKGPVQKGELKGEVVPGAKGWIGRDPDKVRITGTTAELRAYLAANPLKCAPFTWFVFVRAKPHNPTYPAGP